MADTHTEHQEPHPRFPPVPLLRPPILLINFANSIRRPVSRAVEEHGWGVVMALTLVLLALSARLMALAVQDRVIRLEMRLRLQGILPSDLRERINDLTRPQVVALRFASDCGTAESDAEVLGGKYQSQKAIKEQIKNWQGDYLRC